MVGSGRRGKSNAVGRCTTRWLLGSIGTPGGWSVSLSVLSVCLDVDHGKASREGWKLRARGCVKSWSGKPKQVREGKGRPCGPGPGPDFVSRRVSLRIKECVEGVEAADNWLLLLLLKWWRSSCHAASCAASAWMMDGVSKGEILVVRCLLRWRFEVRSWVSAGYT